MHQAHDLTEAAKLGDLETVKTILGSFPELIDRRDDTGATALHYAALGGHSDLALFLIERGADVNARDAKYQATPAGWAIEYLREMGGFLGIELDDFAHAIRKGDVEWTKRFLTRFPALRSAADQDGTPFETLAARSENAEIRRLFE